MVVLFISISGVLSMSSTFAVNADEVMSSVLPFVSITKDTFCSRPQDIVLFESIRIHFDDKLINDQHNG